MPLQVHTHHRIPVLFTQADKHAVAKDAGVVDQHMHFAKRRQRSVDDVLRRGEGGDVIGIGDGLPARLAYFGHHLFCGFATNVVDHHIGALGGERQRVGAAQTAARAGNDDGTSCTNCHVVTPRGAQ